jgi:hypothetical protein
MHLIRGSRTDAGGRRRKKTRQGVGGRGR